MTMYAKHVASRGDSVPQTEQADPAQVRNSAGGFSFAVDDWTRLDRFLILGAEGGSYYASEQALTRENAAAVERCFKLDGQRAVAQIAMISESGRAPKNSPAIFALALAASSKDDKVRAAALRALPRVCRTGTHLFEFAATVQQFRGWGRGLRNAIARWYTEKDAGTLAYQLVKYRQRGGWSHKDLLRLAHPETRDASAAAALRFVVAGSDALGAREVAAPRNGSAPARSYAPVASEALPKILLGWHAAQEPGLSTERMIQLIGEYRLTHEMVPSEHLGKAEVWDALLPHMPLTATIRNLGRMTANGLIAPMSDAVRLIEDRLGDEEYLRKSRIHPLNVLTAQVTYAQGRGMRGSLSWKPEGRVVDALDGAFYRSFGHVTPTGKRTLLALDVSGSMTCVNVAGSPLTPRQASAALALVTANVERDYHLMAFCHQFVPLKITPKMRLDAVIKVMDRLSFGGTDCSLPMRWAIDNPKAKVESMFVYTDAETWAGAEHPHTLLQRYRQLSGIDARSAVVGMVSNGFTIADPSDAGMLDVVGFDSATPELLSAFSRGEV